MQEIENSDGKARTRSEVDEYVGQQIRDARLRQGWSQQRLAQALGLTFQQVQKYEKAINRVSAGVLVRIARALRVSQASLLPAESVDLADISSDPTRAVLQTRGDRDLLVVLAHLSPQQRASLLPVAQQLRLAGEIKPSRH